MLLSRDIKILEKQAFVLGYSHDRVPSTRRHVSCFEQSIDFERSVRSPFWIPSLLQISFRNRSHSR